FHPNPEVHPEPANNLQEEATCAVCLDFFRDPVILLSCGHNFCRRCLEGCSGSCPQCRLPFSPDGFQPNRQLANLVAAVRELATEEEEKEEEEEICRRHRRPLAFFCGRDGTLLCAACAERHPHPAVPADEAAGEYRVSETPAPSPHKKNHFPKNSERLAASLKALQEEDERRAGLVAAAEETRQEMLVGSSTTPGAGTTPRNDAPSQNLELTPLPSPLPAIVTLDPATAHPQILVSADGRTAGRRESPPAPLPSGAERFESLRCVLGLQGFSGGRHRWAVEVRPGPDWALGVAREFVPRKGCFGLSPERGVWAVGQWLGQLRALTWPSPTSLPHGRVPRRIEVALDYAGGRVAFRDADSLAEIFAFPPAAFAGERLRPLLWLGEGPKPPFSFPLNAKFNKINHISTPPLLFAGLAKKPSS
uniref:TRI27 protein n=1 Tax=Calidris pygmaea TaxID=425635 RepID=A0A8C3KJM8_9CHAR